jgi:hypothetical protein
VCGSAGPCEWVHYDAVRAGPYLNNFSKETEWLNRLEPVPFANYSIKLVDSRLAVTRFLMIPRLGIDLQRDL